MMAWIYLLLAICFEVTGTTFMKLSEGLTKLHFAGLMLLFYIASLSFLSLSLKNIEVGVAYAVWSGFGIVLIGTIGIVFFGESISFLKLLFIGLIVIGAIGLNIITKTH